MCNCKKTKITEPQPISQPVIDELPRPEVQEEIKPEEDSEYPLNED